MRFHRGLLLVLVGMVVSFGTVLLALFRSQSTSRKQTETTFFQLFFIQIDQGEDAVLDLFLVLEVLGSFVQKILLILFFFFLHFL